MVPNVGYPILKRQPYFSYERLVIEFQLCEKMNEIPHLPFNGCLFGTIYSYLSSTKLICKFYFKLLMFLFGPDTDNILLYWLQV